ncbi:unnamed protein product [Cuscuta europaea]|uniref:Protein kinase domain-containing protein n=1 Tax=Cuscuta europaea TaxID=41803 RepID=A0A9P0Z4H1_CUSEU|nr:unnamed protein product [Cuscuta europaea]
MIWVGTVAQTSGRHRNVATSHVVIALIIATWLFSSSASSLEDEQEIHDPAGAGSSGATLMEFKTSLVLSANGGAVERALISWNTSISPCSGNVGNWYGMLCLNGDVMGLQLNGLSLSGDIDIDALVPLRFLRFLSFENNEFEGLMPDWRKLGALKSLFLSNNRFSGKIDDDAFSSMGSLKKVHLANNRFTGNIPTSLAITLRLLELRLENNNFTGPIPKFQTGLKMFNASNNQLEGPIPPTLSAMDPSAFSGNKGLCGKPINSDCTSQSPPPPKSPPGTDVGDAESSLSYTLTGILMLIAICLLVVALFIAAYLICRPSHFQLDGGAFDPLFSPNNNPSVSPSPDRLIGGSTPNNNSNPGVGASPSVGKLAFVRTDRTQFNLQDLLRASAEVLGAGELGSSYKAVLIDGQAVVVKRLKHMNQVGREDFHEHMRRLARLEHPNLLPLVAYYYRKEEKLLISNFVPNGSLASHLYGKDLTLDWPSRLRIIKGVAKALSYLHKELTSLVLPHGHLKSSNVLLDKAFNPILMDYAMVPILNPDEVQSILVAYKSPECISSPHHPTRKTDVWTLGVLILETLTATSLTKYLNTQLNTWINSIGKALEGEGSQRETIFDDRIVVSLMDSRVQMQRLLQIGVACCQEDLDARLELNEAVERIDLLKERDDL